MTLTRAERSAFVEFALKRADPSRADVMTGDDAVNYMIQAGAGGA